jgi:hypothetical protein
LSIVLSHNWSIFILHCAFTCTLGHSASIGRHYFNSTHLPSFFPSSDLYQHPPLITFFLSTSCPYHLLFHTFIIWSNTSLYLSTSLSSIKSYHNHPVDQDRRSLSTLDLTEIFTTSYDILKTIRGSLDLKIAFVTVSNRLFRHIYHEL